MSVMDVRKNSRYLHNLRSELGANSVPAMVREAPLRKYSSSFGHCPFGGRGGLNPYQDGLGHLFLGEMSKYKRAFA